MGIYLKGLFAIFLGATLFAGAPARAQDIAWHVAKIAPGSVITVRNRQDGETEFFHHLVRGKSGKHYVVSTFKGRKPGKTPVFTGYFTGEGNIVAYVMANGEKTTYAPHNCLRTIGTCAYTETRPDGTKLKFLRINAPEKSGMRFRVYGSDGRVAREGWIELGRFGTGGDGWQKGADGSSVTYKLVRESYK